MKDLRKIKTKVLDKKSKDIILRISQEAFPECTFSWYSFGKPYDIDGGVDILHIQHDGESYRADGHSFMGHIIKYVHWYEFILTIVLKKRYKKSYKEKQLEFIEDPIYFLNKLSGFEFVEPYKEIEIIEHWSHKII